MKAERVISRRFNHVDRAGSTDFGMGGSGPPHTDGINTGYWKVVIAFIAPEILRTF